MTRYQIALVRRCARAEARIIAKRFSQASFDTYDTLLDECCAEFMIERGTRAYDRLTQAIADYADFMLERAA